MNKLHEALKNEELMLEVGRKATEEQKAMTQSTVEERLNEKLKLCISRIGGINCQCGNPISLNRINDLWIDFIKSEIQLAEQKAREDEQQRIVGIITELKIYGDNERNWEYANACEDIINQITNS